MLALALFALLRTAQDPTPAPATRAAAENSPLGLAEIRPRQWLLLAPVDERGRRPFREDAVFARYLSGTGAAPPRAGEEVQGSTGAASWESFTLGEDGVVRRDGELAYAYTAVEVDAPRVWIAELSGAATLFVNGEAFAGDLYGLGQHGVPVALRAGTNTLFVTGIRSSFRLRLWPPDHRLQYAAWTARVPDLVVGGEVATEASITVMNASTEPLVNLHVSVGGNGPFARVELADLGGIPPLGIRRIPLPLRAREGHPLPKVATPLEVAVDLGGEPSGGSHRVWLRLGMVDPGAVQVRSFRSRIDDSVQEYAVLPPAPPADEVNASDRVGVVLSLHGAGVRARDQAASYAPKTDWWILAPTNRAPFGFDWQDWGREDAYEALADLLRREGLSRSRVVLTGHSMGGHGAWSLAVHDPGGFAAVAPSAGWCSFDTYVGRPPGKLAELWHGADGSSETLALLSNLRGKAIYVLHGEKDDNVPLTEAERMAKALADLGISFTFHVQPGAGHWWGSPCVDWPPIFEVFRGRSIPEMPAVVDFTSAGIGIQARDSWLVLLQPIHYGERLHAHAEWREADGGTIEIHSRNLRAFRIERPHARILIDGQELRPDRGEAGCGYRMGEDGNWEVFSTPSATEGKNPLRSGPFKRAFRNRFRIVYGTAGSPAENAALLARARYDAEVWSYRSNGDARPMSDQDFLRALAAGDCADCDLILYGNAETNAAWRVVLPGDCPLRARNGLLRLGKREWSGSDQAAVFCFPRRGVSQALVGVFADSGLLGIRLGYTLAPFVSGVGYPDFVLYDSSVLHRGDEGVHAAGYFDSTWHLDSSAPPGSFSGGESSSPNGGKSEGGR